MSRTAGLPSLDQTLDELDADQMRLLRTLVEEYVRNAEFDAADALLRAIAEADRQAPDPSEFGLKVAAPLGDIAIRAENLGVRYNLNFTKKTKLRTTFANLLDPRRRIAGHGENVFDVPPDRSDTAVGKGRRQEAGDDERGHVGRDQRQRLGARRGPKGRRSVRRA